ncbi:MAG TPA: glycosyltransferase family 87 protein [Sphingomonadaceae bacterium]|nr:glycosyltransferase family 87 protein [Sphingomonadaceae bacterium]
MPFYLATLDLHWPVARDGTGLVVGRDFLNFWMYGRAALGADPARFYDLLTYWSAVESVVGAGYPRQQWSYPPSAMLLAAPFGALPYFVALSIWTGIGLVLFVAALRLWIGHTRHVFILVLAPAAVFGLMSGQFAFVATAAILTVLRWRQSRPVFAGIILGTLTIKPQLVIFFPVLLLATGNWRMIAAAFATAAVLAGATALVWGIEVWVAYVRTGLGNQSLVLTDPAVLGGPFMPTIFMNARTAGVSVDVAATLQLVASACAAALIWRTFRRRPAATDLRANGIFLAAAAFGTPYLLSYDTLPLTVAAVLLMIDGARPRWPLMLVYFLPLIQMVAGTHGIPGPASIAVGVALWLSRKDGRGA